MEVPTKEMSRRFRYPGLGHVSRGVAVQPLQQGFLLRRQVPRRNPAVGQQRRPALRGHSAAPPVTGARNRLSTQPEAHLIRQKLHVDGPVLLGRALGEEDVLEGVDQVDVALFAQGGAAVLKQHRLVQHPLGVEGAKASLRVPQELGRLAAVDGEIGQQLLRVWVHQPHQPVRSQSKSRSKEAGHKGGVRQHFVGGVGAVALVESGGPAGVPPQHGADFSAHAHISARGIDENCHLVAAGGLQRRLDVHRGRDVPPAMKAQDVRAVVVPQLPSKRDVNHR